MIARLTRLADRIDVGTLQTRHSIIRRLVLVVNLNNVVSNANSNHIDCDFDGGAPRNYRIVPQNILLSAFISALQPFRHPPTHPWRSLLGDHLQYSQSLNALSMNSISWKHHLTRLSKSLGREQATMELRWMQRSIPRDTDSSSSTQKLDSMVGRRLLGEPLQYILGTPWRLLYVSLAYSVGRDPAIWRAEPFDSATCANPETGNRGLDCEAC